MKIKTDSPIVKKAREGVMEFLLASLCLPASTLILSLMERWIFIASALQGLCRFYKFHDIYLSTRTARHSLATFSPGKTASFVLGPIM